MPNYFYVKSGGTRGTSDTPYSSQQTGSFATLGTSNYYDNIIEPTLVTTNPAAPGDFILVSDAHSHNYGANANIYFDQISIGAGINVISVSDTACDTYSRGAAESATGGTYDIAFRGWASLSGIDFAADDDIICALNGQVFYDCTFTASATTDRCMAILNDATTRFINCTFNYNHVTADPINFNGNTRTEFLNCTFATTASYADPVFDNTFSNESFDVTCIGCDFSGLSSTYLFQSPGWDAVSDDGRKITFINCKLPATLTDFYDNTYEPFDWGHEFTVIGSASSSGAQEYQYCYLNGLGRVEDNTAIYRTGSTAFPSTTKISLRVDSTANCSQARPFIFDFPTRYSALSSTSTDKITIYITCASTLNNDEVYAEVIYPDGTNKHTPNVEESIGEHFIHGDFRTTTPVALTTNTEAWTGALTNKYQLDIDTSTDAGADCVPIIRVYVAKASTTVYFCPTLGLS